MKIFIVGKFNTEGFAKHIAETLEAMGHSVFRFDPGVPYEDKHTCWRARWRKIKTVAYELWEKGPWAAKTQERTLWACFEKAGNVDLVLVCHDFLRPQLVDFIKTRTKASVIMWYPDHLGVFGRSYFLNSRYDAVFFKDPYIVEALSGICRYPVYYLPECFNPYSLSPVALTDADKKVYGADITTAGNLYPYRIALFSHLTNYDVKIWGTPPSGWLDISAIGGMLQNHFVADGEKVKAFTGAKILLNNLYHSEIWGINARAFEAAGAGAFQLIDWRPGLAQLFEDGKELISFRGIEDLKHKIDYWLPREAERLNIAAAGMRRAHAEHTYELRLGLLLDTLAGTRNGYPTPPVRYH